MSRGQEPAEHSGGHPALPQTESVHEPGGPTERDAAASMAVLGATDVPRWPPASPFAGRGRTQPAVGSSRRRLRRWLLSGFAVCLALSLLGVNVFREASQLQHALVLARDGAQRLEAVQADTRALQQNPFDAAAATRIGTDSRAAFDDFTAVSQALQSVPGVATSVPRFGDDLSGASRLVSIALDLSRAGMIGSQALSLVIARLHSPLDSTQQGITPADLSLLRTQTAQLTAEIQDALNQARRLTPQQISALQAQSPSLGRQLATLRTEVPVLQGYLGEAQVLLGAAPQVLGVGTPSNYLVEVLDSTEIRPGGGFIGNYGTITVSGGRLQSAHITDTYLLDLPFESRGGYIPVPSQYGWFGLASNWGLRDSNLDADFPTSARNAMSNFLKEGGTTSVQGVIAITPWFVERVLQLTGPIQVPEYGETITAQNLVDRIHYYQLGPGHGTDRIASPDGHSSTRKRFTELLSESLLAKVRALPATDVGTLVQIASASVRSKDIQVYLTNSAAEQVLAQQGLASGILAPSGDTLFVVDANVTATKANYYMQNTVQDHVTLEADGSALHRTTITSAWTKPGSPYGNPIYGDYLQVYAPAGSILTAQSGWSYRGASQQHGLRVWAGYFELRFGQSKTITLVWQTPHAATHDGTGWHYHYEIQRQAGQPRELTVQVTLPGCASAPVTWTGLKQADPQTGAYSGALTANARLGADYSCTP